MDIVKLLQDLTASISALQAQLVDAQAAADSIAKENFDKGFAAGVASVPPAGDKVFSQADLDAAVAKAVEPLNAQVVDLQAQVLALQSSIDEKIADGVKAVKADLLSKYQALEVAIQEKETGFEELLK